MAGSLLAAPVANPIQATSATQQELILADGLCPKIAELLPGALHEVVSLGLSSNPLQAITEELAARRTQGQAIDTLHIVAHGRPGAFQIGGQWVDAEAMLANAHRLAQWQVRTIALWSCKSGSDKTFIALLAELTGAEAQYSLDIINANNWTLNSRPQTANNTVEPPFDAESRASWTHELAISDYYYYATFTEVAEAIQDTGSTFFIGQPVPGTTFRVYPVDPTDPAALITEFFANGSSASVWLVIDGGTPQELFLTNGAQASGGDGGPEDKWILADDTNIGQATIIYALSSGTYQLTRPTDQINSSISLADLDELAQFQLVPTVSSVVADDPSNADAGDTSVAEGNNLRYDVTLSTAVVSPATYTYTLAGGSAAAGDFNPTITWSTGVTDNGNGTITLAAGVTSFFATVSTIDDAGVESTETLILTIGGVAGSGNILDNDFPSISAVVADDPSNSDPADTSVVEGNDLRYDVTLSTAVVSPATYTYTLAGGSAAAGDFNPTITWSTGVTDNGNGTITLAAGVTSFFATVSTIDDAGVESTETLILTIGGVAGTGNILDNDFPSISAVVADDPSNSDPADTSVVEGNDLRYDVTLSTAVVSPATYTYTLAGGSAAAGDFNPTITWSTGVTDNGNGTITLAAGVTSFFATVSTIDDAGVESTETLILTIGGVAGSGNILDNDFPSISAVVADDPSNSDPADTSVVEGNDLRYDVTLSTAVVSPATYTYTLAGGSAAAGDFNPTITWSTGVTDNGNGTITLAAGVTSFFATVSTIDDAGVESTETLILTIGGVAGSGNILDNDFPSISAVVADDPSNSDPADTSVVEGNDLRYDVTLSTAVVSPATYTYTLAGGSAAAGDFNPTITWSTGVTDNGNGTITLAAGVTSFFATVSTIDDAGVESTETLILTIGGVAGTGNILDNDFPSISAVVADDPSNSDPADTSVVEGNDLRYDVTLSTAVVSPATYTYTLAGGSAAAGDFNPTITWSTGVTDNGNGTITLAAGVTSFFATVSTIDDAGVESTETLILTIGGVAGSGNILDNDFPSISAVVADDPSNSDPADTSVVEGNDLRYDVTLSTAVVSPATYTYTLAGGSAAAGDFNPTITWSTGVTDNGNGTITLAAGVTSFFATVSTIDDAGVESTETLILTIGGVAGSGNILDNDFPSISAVVADDPSNSDPADTSVVEGNDLRYDVTLSTAVVSPATYTYTLAGGSAAAGDFNPTITWSTGVTDNGNGTITLAAGVTSFFATVSTIDDAGVESTETLILTIGGVAGTGNILDNDAAAPAPTPAPAPAPAPTPTPTPTAEPDNDGIPSNTEEQLAAINSGDGDTNDDGIPDFQQAAIATLAWIDDVNFENAIAGDFAAVPKQSIITVQSIQQDGSLNSGTALQDIKVIAFEDVPVGAPTDVFVEWTPIQFALTGTTPGAALADVDNGRAGTQTTVLINNSAAGLPSNYFDRYYTYVSEDIIARYAAAGLQLRSLDGEILSNASQAGWYDFTQRSPGGDGGRYITKDGKIVGVEITFTDNAFGDDDPTSNRILDPSTLVLGPSPRFTLKTDSQEIGDRITANGLPEVRMLGGPGEAAAITLVGADGDLLERDRHYSVREITVDGVRSVYAIQFLDADLAKAGAQSFGRFFTGQATGNNANTTDGTYTVLLNGEAAGSLQIRTNALSDRQRLKCLNNLDGKKSLESKLFGYRIENQRGTNSDDVLIGNGGNNKFNGGNGSDLINAFGERFAGNSINRSTDLNQRDLLTGGKSADYFQLGDLVGSFYVGDGRNGYARISDFRRGDRIVLTGSETDYTIKNASVGGQSGRGVFQGDDLVALIQGSASDSLRITNPNQVLFI